MRVRVGAIVALLTSVIVAVGVPSSAGAATGKGPKPVITSFAVTAFDPTFVALSTTPLVLYNAGGFVELSVNATNTTACNFTSDEPISGLPSSGPCTTIVQLPANAGTKPVTYKLRAEAIGFGFDNGGPISVTVSPAPNPNPVTGVTPGSTWTLMATGGSCGPGSNPSPETFNPNGTVSNGPSGSIFGTYSLDQTTGVLTIDSETIIGVVIFTFDFVPSEDIYTGSDNFLNCSWTLSP